MMELQKCAFTAELGVVMNINVEQNEKFLGFILSRLEQIHAVPDGKSQCNFYMG
jgi:hypothetical protein